MTAVVVTKEASVESARYLLWLPCTPMEKIEPRCERMFSEWKISHSDIVRNAMVMPSGLSTISHFPASMKCPTKYAARVSSVTKRP